MLEISKRPHGDVLEISLRGEIDAYAAADIKIFFQEAKAEKHKYYLINFDKVSKLNYSAVQNINAPIVDLMGMAPVHVCGIPASIDRMLKNTKFYTKAVIHPTKKEALAEIFSG